MTSPVDLLHTSLILGARLEFDRLGLTIDVPVVFSCEDKPLKERIDRSV